MASKRQELRPNKATGNFERLLGWKCDPATKATRQHKFYLGTDPTAAALANQRLERLWAIIEGEAGDSDALWDRLTLDIGKAIAKGKSESLGGTAPQTHAPERLRWLPSRSCPSIPHHRVRPRRSRLLHTRCEDGIDREHQGHSRCEGNHRPGKRTFEEIRPARPCVRRHIASGTRRFCGSCPQYGTDTSR